MVRPYFPFRNIQACVQNACTWSLRRHDSSHAAVRVFARVARYYVHIINPSITPSNLDNRIKPYARFRNNKNRHEKKHGCPASGAWVAIRIDMHGSIQRYGIPQEGIALYPNGYTTHAIVSCMCTLFVLTQFLHMPTEKVCDYNGLDRGDRPATMGCMGG